MSLRCQSIHFQFPVTPSSNTVFTGELARKKRADVRGRRSSTHLPFQVMLTNPKCFASPFSDTPCVSTMEAKSQHYNLLHSLNAAIAALDQARSDMSGTTSVLDAFDATSTLLTTIRVRFL